MHYWSLKNLTFYKIVAFIAALAVVMWSLGLPGWLHTAQAAVTNFSDTLSDSDLGVTSNHLLEFTTENGVTDDDSTMTITFASGFDIGTTSEDDLDILVGGTQLTTAADCSSTEEVGISTSTDAITLQFCSGDAVTPVAASSVLRIFIGSTASSSGTGATKIC